jgi:osmotically-inducible protein OsmY
MLKILALFLLPLMALTIAHPTPAVAATSPTKAASAQPRSPVGDAQLEATIKTKLAKSKIGKDGFHFKVQRGIVTWEGTTNIGQHKGAATRMARTSGAVQVINNIKVSNTGKDAVLRKAYVEP